MTSNVWRCFCRLGLLIAFCTYYISVFQHYHVTQRLVKLSLSGTTMWKHNQKYKTKTKTKTKAPRVTKTEAGLRPVLSQDCGLRPQNCS